jgi:hypothetical protein
MLLGSGRPPAPYNNPNWANRLNILEERWQDLASTFIIVRLGDKVQIPTIAMESTIKFFLSAYPSQIRSNLCWTVCCAKFNCSLYSTTIVASPFLWTLSPPDKPQYDPPTCVLSDLSAREPQKTPTRRRVKLPEGARSFQIFRSVNNVNRC